MPTPLLASAPLLLAQPPALQYRMLPGQSFASFPSDATWHVSTWRGVCVIKRDPAPDKTCCPFAVVTTEGAGACPVGAVFNASTAVRVAGWMPFDPVAAPVVHTFDGARDRGGGVFGLESCQDDAVMLSNTRRLNDMLRSVAPGDTLVVPKGTFCMAAGVLSAARLRHATVDVQGELVFGQPPRNWTQDAGGHFMVAMDFRGITNVTFTSTTRSGVIRAKSCTQWYLVRATNKISGGNHLFQVGQDDELTFASSRVVVEYLTFQDSPNYLSNFMKVHDLTVRHCEMVVTCFPQLRRGRLNEVAGALEVYTDGIDVWGSDVHIHDVRVVNGDDCICSKGNNDGSGLMSENWLVENSTISGEGLSIGTMWSGDFVTRNVTWRNIVARQTRKAIYIKIDSHGNKAIDILYQNITVEGPTLQWPVHIGAIHQFSGGCPAQWPLRVPQPHTCSVQNNAEIDVTIDGLYITRPNGLVLADVGLHAADFVIIGNNRTRTEVKLRDVTVDGASGLPTELHLEQCSDPPTSWLGGYCGNACYAANVTTDGSYPITCLPYNDTVANGTCAPQIGSVSQRCASGQSRDDKLCRSGKRCT